MAMKKLMIAAVMITLVIIPLIRVLLVKKLLRDIKTIGNIKGAHLLMYFSLKCKIYCNYSYHKCS